MKWKPYHTDIAICIVSGLVGLFIGDVISYWLRILNPLGIVLGVVLMLPWYCLYGYSRVRAWRRKQTVQRKERCI